MDEDEQNLQKALQASMQPEGASQARPIVACSHVPHPGQLHPTYLICLQQAKQQWELPILTSWYGSTNFIAHPFRAPSVLE